MSDYSRFYRPNIEPNQSVVDKMKAEQQRRKMFPLPKVDKSKVKIDFSKSKRFQRINSRVVKVNKRIEKFEIKSAKAQYANDKKQLMQRDLGVVNLVFGIIFVLFLISFIVNYNNQNFTLPTFANFIELINSTQKIQIPILNFDNNVTDIPIIGEILSGFSSIVNVIIFLLNGVVQVVLFAFNIIKWLFML